MYAVHYTLYIVHCTLYIVHCTLHIHCMLNIQNMTYAVHLIPIILYSPPILLDVFVFNGSKYSDTKIVRRAMVM